MWHEGNFNSYSPIEDENVDCCMWIYGIFVEFKSLSQFLKKNVTSTDLSKKTIKFILKRHSTLGSWNDFATENYPSMNSQNVYIKKYPFEYKPLVIVI